MFKFNKNKEEVKALKKQLIEKEEEIKSLKKQIEQHDILQQTMQHDFSTVRKKYESLKVSLNSILENKEEEIKEIEEKINQEETEKTTNELLVTLPDISSFNPTNKIEYITINGEFNVSRSVSREAYSVIKKVERMKEMKRKLEIEANELRKKNEDLQKQTVLYQELTKNITEKQKELMEIRLLVENGNHQLLDKLLEVKGELKELELELTELLKEKEKLTQQVINYSANRGNILIGNNLGRDTNLAYTNHQIQIPPESKPLPRPTLLLRK